MIISSCKVDFFHRCWPSSTLLLPLFTSACCEIGQKPCLLDGRNVIEFTFEVFFLFAFFYQIPKVEALTILSGLVCFPNHFEQLDVLSNKDTEFLPTTMERTALKRMIMRDLIKASQNDAMLESRYEISNEVQKKNDRFCFSREIALCGLAIFLCEELKHQRIESPIRPFIVFIVECLQVSSSSRKRKLFCLQLNTSERKNQTLVICFSRVNRNSHMLLRIKPMYVCFLFSLLNMVILKKNQI